MELFSTDTLIVMLISNALTAALLKFYETRPGTILSELYAAAGRELFDRKAISGLVEFGSAKLKQMQGDSE